MPLLAFEVEGTSLVLGGEPGRRLVVDLRAAFGPLEYRWTIDDVPISAEGIATLDVIVPEAAFLHPLAEDYVTDLDMVVTEWDGGRAIRRFAGVDLFLAWPQGRNLPPVIWDSDGLQSHAPWGVVDAELRLRVPAGTVATVRFLPPIWHLFDSRQVEDSDGSLHAD